MGHNVSRERTMRVILLMKFIRFCCVVGIHLAFLSRNWYSFVVAGSHEKKSNFLPSNNSLKIMSRIMGSVCVMRLPILSAEIRFVVRSFAIKARLFGIAKRQFRLLCCRNVICARKKHPDTTTLREKKYARASN